MIRNFILMVIVKATAAIGYSCGYAIGVIKGLYNDLIKSPPTD